MEVSKTSTDAYPDLVAAGSLSNAIQNSLRKLGSTLQVTELDRGHNFVAYARVGEGARSSQIYIAAKERLFLVDFWNKGVMLAQGQTPNLDEMTRAIDKWISSKLKIGELTREHSFVSAEPSAFVYEEGKEVEHRWQCYLNSTTHPELVDLVQAASKREQLRSLFPFTSLNNLCFSRCTGYPYSRDVPYIRPIANGRFQVCDYREKVLGSGNAEEALDITIANLPGNCGPAIAGTAIDLDMRRIEAR